MTDHDITPPQDPNQSPSAEFAHETLSDKLARRLGSIADTGAAAEATRALEPETVSPEQSQLSEQLSLTSGEAKEISDLCRSFENAGFQMRSGMPREQFDATVSSQAQEAIARLQDHSEDQADDAAMLISMIAAGAVPQLNSANFYSFTDRFEPSERAVLLQAFDTISSVQLDPNPDTGQKLAAIDGMLRADYISAVNQNFSERSVAALAAMGAGATFERSEVAAAHMQRLHDLLFKK